MQSFEKPSCIDDEKLFVVEAILRSCKSSRVGCSISKSHGILRQGTTLEELLIMGDMYEDAT